MKLRLILLSLLLLATITGAVLAASDPEPGSHDDPLVTKSYVDHLSSWQRVQVSSGGALNINEGTEFVVVYTKENSTPVSGDTSKLDKLIDLTAGATVGNSALQSSHHYICAASGEFSITFGNDVQLLVRGAP